MVTHIDSYEFVSPGKIVFGWGRRQEVGELARTLGQRAFLVWGSRTLQADGMAGEIRASLAKAGTEAVDLATITREPLVADVDATAWALRQMNGKGAALVIGIGGGSAIDLAKAVAAMATNHESKTVQDYLEGVGCGLKLMHTPLPVLAIPTTAGTGSEATKNSVISSHDPRFKKSLRSDQMLPRIVLVDPELTVSCLPAVTAHSGMDAITQCIESYVSRKARPLAATLAAEGLRCGVQSIEQACEIGTSRRAREGMSQAALLSGLALANSGLGMAHGVAAALGVQLNIPHGLACAVMLRPTLAANLETCEVKYAELEKLLGGGAESHRQLAHDFVRRIHGFCDRLQIPHRLSRLGVTAEMIPELVANSRGNSMDGNPRNLEPSHLTEILEEML